MQLSGCWILRPFIQCRTDGLCPGRGLRKQRITECRSSQLLDSGKCDLKRPISCQEGARIREDEFASVKPIQGRPRRISCLAAVISQAGPRASVEGWAAKPTPSPQRNSIVRVRQEREER